MTNDQTFALGAVGGGVLALFAAAFLLLFRAGYDREIAQRIDGLRQHKTEARPLLSRLLSGLVSLVVWLGNTTRDRMLSARATEALVKTLEASGLEPSKAIPIFVGAKIVSLFCVPPLVFLVTILLNYPGGKQLLFTGLSLVVAIMLPNWVIALLRGSYQKALRRGLPDALDLMVVCVEAGLGLESAVQRVAQEMRQSNRPVSAEFSLLSHEMRILPDRRIALTNLGERTGQPSLTRFAGTIAQTLKYGTPLSQGLRTLAAEMRDERMIQFEERAGRLPALLVVPMILFILPCLFIILMGQPASKLIDAFAGMK